MKENSIKGDIKDLKKYISFSKKHENFSHDTDWKWHKEIGEKIERVLKENEVLLKENEKLKNEVMEKDLEIIGKVEYTEASMKEIIEQYYTANEDCITKQRIEDIIDRIDYDIKKTKEIISNDLNIYTSNRRNDYQILRLRAMNTKSLDIKKRLQKLLESEE